ncbi:MAG: MaoC family dehydratase [Mycobacteriales bacterium]
MTVRYDRPPSLLASSARALVRRGSGAELPEAVAELPEVTVDRAHLARYAAVCGFPAAGPLPPTYPHVLAFPLALALMTRRDFPYRPLGLIHVANRITTRRPLAATEQLDLRVWLEGPRPHPRGTAFTIATSVSAGGGEPAWEEASTYLRRERRPTGGASEAEPAPRSPVDVDVEAEEAWRLPADTGRRYAAASGDRNPIHLYPWTARPFGFRRPIAHGMWTAARALAALGDALPTAATVDVTFRAAIPLPATVRFTTGGTAFAVTSEDGTRPHLYGLVTPV